MSVKNILSPFFGFDLHYIFNNISEEFFESIEEIRLRIDKPIIITKKNEEFYINKDGEIIDELEYAYCPSFREIKKTLDLMSGYSLYAFEEEIKYGYLTLRGGHRVGITGKVVSEKGQVVTIKNINGLNIRISHEVLECSQSIIPYIRTPEIKHTMIISPPACGKTTLLRDVIRKLSNGDNKNIGQTVGLVDERSEIAGCYLGIPQNEVGIRTDILDGCPKAVGMKILLRTMAPKIIAVDEIGSKEDVLAIDEVINAGVKIICTVHGKDIDDLLQKPVLKDLLERKIFERYIVLNYDKCPGNVFGIYNSDYERLCD